MFNQFQVKCFLMTRSNITELVINKTKDSKLNKFLDFFLIL